MAGALAIDPGKTLGWARPGLAGVLPLAAYEDEGQATAAFMQWLADRFTEDRPSVIVFEAAFFKGRFTPHADFTAGLIRAGHATAFIHDVPRREIAANTVRLAVFGKATGHSDPVRVAKARALGFAFVAPPGVDEAEVANHAADAALLLHVAGGGHG